MTKRSITALSTTAVVVLLLVVVWLKSDRGLYVHMRSSSWSDVAVQSKNLSKPVMLRSSTGRSTLKANEISHGVYNIHVRFKDGKEFWATLFHYDAGVRQRLDVYIERVPGTETIKVKEFANQVDLVFKGEKRASKTTRKEPFELDWI